jgi:DNA-binding transcriptional MocR family regulator
MHRVSGHQLALQLGASWHSGGSPIYRALADAIQVLLLDGRLPLAAALPAERDLAAALDVSRTTVTGAYGRLRDGGYLRSRRGSGHVTELPSRPREPRTVGWAPPTGDEGIDLAVAALPGPEPALSRAAQAAVTRLPSYTLGHGYDTAGLRPLRDAIAERYTRRGVTTAADEILVTNGAQHALVLALRLLTRPGQRVVVECPTFPNALSAIEAAHCTPLPVRLADDGWPVDVLTDRIRHANPAACYLIPDFHNPTGLVMPAADRAAIVGAAAQAGTYLLVDETFADLGLDGAATAIPPMAAFDDDRRVISIGSLSKSHWGGLRVGWIRATAPLIRRLADCRAGLDMAQPILDQLVAIELLSDPDILPAQRALLRKRRDVLAARLREALPAWTFRTPAGGMALWVDLGAPISTALSLAAARMGVVVPSGTRFGDAAGLENRLRIPFTAPDERLGIAVDRLARASAAAQRQTIPLGATNVA